MPSNKYLPLRFSDKYLAQIPYPHHACYTYYTSVLLIHFNSICWAVRIAVHVCFNLQYLG
jgi:hypothetical protein